MSKQQDKTFAERVVEFAVLPGIEGASLVVNAAIATVLWEWFAVRSLGLRSIPLATMMGFILLIDLIKDYSIGRIRPTPAEEPTPFEQLPVSLKSKIGRPLAILFFGWLVHRFA